MRRLFPHPVLAGLLLALWLILQQSAELKHILLGGLIAIAASFAAAAVVPEPVRLRKPYLIGKLVVVAGLDIIASNFVVLSVLLQPKIASKAGFVEMELELTNTFGLAILACLITATPGSAWLEHNRARSTVLIHVLELDDPQDWAKTIKARYETLLLEIFQ